MTFTDKRKGWLLMTIAMIIYFVMMMYTIPFISNNHEILIFDLRPLGYSMQNANDILNSLSRTQLNVYKNIQLPLDMFYPPLLGLAGYFLFRDISKQFRVYKYLLFLPFITIIGDLLENVFIYIMLSGGSVESFNIFASSFTVIKSISTTVFLSLLFLGFILQIIIVGRNYYVRRTEKKRTQ